MSSEEQNAIKAMEAGEDADRRGDHAAAAAHYREAEGWYRRAAFFTSDLSATMARLMAEGAEHEANRESR